MAKKQQIKPTVGDAFGHLTGFFKTTGLLAIRGVSESAHLVANVSDKAFTPSKKKRNKNKELDINKTLKRIEKNFKALEQRDLELANHITQLQQAKRPASPKQQTIAAPAVSPKTKTRPKQATA